MTFASILLLGMVAGLVVYDWASLRGQNRRAILVEVTVFVLGAFFIAFPNRATELAHFVGIGRGVDFLLYPLVIWLVRESLLTRRRRLRDEVRFTELARTVALVEARALPAKAEDARASLASVGGARDVGPPAGGASIP